MTDDERVTSILLLIFIIVLYSTCDFKNRKGENDFQVFILEYLVLRMLNLIFNVDVADSYKLSCVNMCPRFYWGFFFWLDPLSYNFKN